MGFQAQDRRRKYLFEPNRVEGRLLDSLLKKFANKINLPLVIKVREVILSTYRDYGTLPDINLSIHELLLGIGDKNVIH